MNAKEDITEVVDGIPITFADGLSESFISMKEMKEKYRKTRYDPSNFVIIYTNISVNKETILSELKSIRIYSNLF